MTAVDPLDVLERIHHDVQLLRELAGDALVITIAPAPPAVPTAAAPSRPAAAPEVTSAIKPRIVECIRNLERPTFSAIAHELYPGSKVSRAHQPAKAVAKLLDAMERDGEIRRDGTFKRGPIYRVVERQDRPAVSEADDLEDDKAPRSLPLSPRTRRAIDREQADAQAIAALGDPPTSRVFDLLRREKLTIHEVAARLGESQVIVAEEVHHLKPWLIQLHDGRLRAIERLRPAEAA